MTRIVIVAAVIVLVAHLGYLASVQGPFCTDDAYISFRYARNLVEGHGLVYNVGERVEGYTNFGWVMAMALVERLGLDTPSVSRFVSAIVGIGLLALSLLFLTRRARHVGWALAIAAVLLALDGSIARWSQGGLETITFAFLVLAGAVLEVHAPDRPRFGSWAALVFGLATLTRPEGALFFAVTLGFFVLTGRDRGRGLAFRLGAYLFAVLPFTLWKWGYYGDLLPNTYYAKVGFGAEQFERGLRYLATVFVKGRWPVLLLLAPSLVLAVKDRLSHPWKLYFLALAGVHLLYVAYVGGDWIGPGRFVVPVLALIYLPVAESVAELLSSRRWSRQRKLLGATVIVLLALNQAIATSWLAERRNLSRASHVLRSRDTVAHFLAENASPGDTVLTGEIGQVGWVSRLYVHDLYGLVDPHVAHLATGPLGGGKAGHEKRDLAYSIGLRPDWISIPGLAGNLNELREVLPELRDYRRVRVEGKMPVHHYRMLLARRAR